MPTLHLWFAWAIFVGYGAAMVWGLGAWIGRRTKVSVRYWWWHRIIALLLLLQIIFGLVLLAQGHRPPDLLHYMYAAILVVGVVFVEMLKPGGSMRRRYAQAGRPLREAPLASFLGFALFAIALRSLMTG